MHVGTDDLSQFLVGARKTIIGKLETQDVVAISLLLRVMGSDPMNLKAPNFHCLKDIQMLVQSQPFVP